MKTTRYHEEVGDQLYDDIDQKWLHCFIAFGFTTHHQCKDCRGDGTGTIYINWDKVRLAS